MAREREPAGSPTALLGARLARDLASLARIELETATSARAARLRPLRRDLLLAGVALCSFAAATLFASLACLRLLESDMRGWLAALVVGLGWLLVAVVAMRRVSRVVRAWGARQAAAARAGDGAKAAAEADAARTLEALLDLLVEELAHSEEHRVERAARARLAAAEHDLERGPAALLEDVDHAAAKAPRALGELVEIATLPARAALGALGRLLSYSDEDRRHRRRSHR